MTKQELRGIRIALHDAIKILGEGEQDIKDQLIIAYGIVQSEEYGRFAGPAAREYWRQNRPATIKLAKRLWGFPTITGGAWQVTKTLRDIRVTDRG